MAYKTYSSLLAQISIVSILLAAAGQALAARGIAKDADNADAKQPEWFTKSDPSVLIPGIGRVMVPPAFRIPHHHHSSISGGSTGGVGTPSTPTGGSYVPGGDDTFVPNPGFEVPTPGSAGGVPAPARP